MRDGGARRSRLRRTDFFRARNYAAARLLDGLGVLVTGRSRERGGSSRPIRGVLCLVLDRLGDVLMTTSALPAVRELYPAARVTVAVPSSASDLVACRPDVDEVVRLDLPWSGSEGGGAAARRLTRFADAVWRLRERRFDLSISFHADPSGHLIQRVVGARARVAPAYKGGGWLLTETVETSPHVHVLDRVAAVVRTLGWSRPLSPPSLPLPEDTRRRARAFLASAATTAGGPPVAIAPGGRDLAKLWPIRSWARLAEMLVALDGQPPLLVGGPGDRAVCDGIKHATTAPLVDATGWSLLETAALLEGCRVVVTVDSVARHLAAAVGTRVVVLQYAAERPGTWAAYGTRHEVIRKQVACSPCGRMVCPRPTHDCMTAITPDEIFAVLARQPERSAQAPGI